MTLELVVSVWPSVNWRMVWKSIWTGTAQVPGGLNGTEIAISESQSACLWLFVQKMLMPLSQPVPRKILMQLSWRPWRKNQVWSLTWNGQTIVDIERSFLDTNRVRVVVDAKVVDSQVAVPEVRMTSLENLEADTFKVLSDLNHTTKRVSNHLWLFSRPLNGQPSNSVAATKSANRKFGAEITSSKWCDKTALCDGPRLQPLYRRMVSVSRGGLCGHWSNCRLVRRVVAGPRLASLIRNTSSGWTSRQNVLASLWLPCWAHWSPKFSWVCLLSEEGFHVWNLRGIDGSANSGSLWGDNSGCGQGSLTRI